MKKQYSPISIPKFFLFVVVLCVGFSTHLNAQIIKEFQPRSSQETPEKTIYNVHGDFTIIGNTNMTLQNYSDTRLNSNNVMIAVDTDNDNSTSNSSSAQLNYSIENNLNPDCTEVVYAGLYWSARTKSQVSNSIKRSIKFKTPNGSYQTVTAKPGDIAFPGEEDMYVAYTEVTDLVKNAGQGDYWVADMAISTGNGGSTGYYGGWSLIVVYQNSQMNPRDITVFDGYAYVEGNVVAEYNLPISGFHTSQEGPVNMKLGMVASEGDVGISGDYFKIKKHSSNQYLTLQHSKNSSNNFFNSSIVNDDPRNPNLKNNTGIDISILNVPNENNSVVTNNQTSTTFKYGSTQDTYVIYSLAMSVDAYQPEIEGISSISSINGQNYTSGTTVQPGQEVTYKIELRNKGTEALENVSLNIPIPYNATYVLESAYTNIYYAPNPTPNSIDYNPNQGSNGVLTWEIGDLPVVENNNTLLAELYITVKATENCTLLKYIECQGNSGINFVGALNGKGKITGVGFQNTELIQGYQTNGTCIGEPIRNPLFIPIDSTQFIQDNCSNENDLTFQFCDGGSSISFSSIADEFPVNTRFYDSFPLTQSSTEYTFENPFPNSTKSYFAVLPGVNDCYIPFTLQIEELKIEFSAFSKSCDNSYGSISVDNYDPAIQYILLDNNNAPTEISISDSGIFLELEPGQYRIKATSERCEIISAIITVLDEQEIPELPSNITVDPATCGLNNGSISFDVNSNYEYVLRDANEIIVTGEGTFPSLASGNYSLTVYNKNCQNSTIIELTETLDNVKPVITACAADITNQPADEGSCSATNVNLGTITATDNCDTNLTITNDAPNVFPAGSTTVTWTVTDDAGNFTTCTQVVTVVDNQDPKIISCAADKTVNADAGLCTASGVDLGSVEATDNCDTDLSITNNAPAIFPAGKTTVIWTITDDAGNSVTCEQEITVIDNQDPVITACAADISDLPADNGSCSATNVNLGSVTATDNCDADLSITNNAPSEFPLGETVVTWTVTDDAGNSVTCEQTITVVDTQKPVITSCASDITNQPADEGSCSATNVNLGNITATDNCDTDLTITNDAPTVFQAGTTIVTWTVKDKAGNIATCTQSVTVVDTEDPVITSCATDKTVNADNGFCYATGVDLGSITATDNCDTNLEITNNAPAQFPVGTTTVTWTVKDDADNTAICTQKITVVDNQDPTTEQPDNITVNADPTICGATVNFNKVGAEDNCGLESVEITEGLSSGEVFPVGTTTVTWTVTDIHGNTTTVSFDVTVVDNTKPIISCPGDMVVPTAEGEDSVIVNFNDATATDNCDVTVEQTAGPTSGSDLAIGTYTVEYTATDASGNTATCSFKIEVVDDEDPTISCPGDISDINDEGVCGAVVTFATPDASDNSGSVAVEQVAGPASGSVFPVGTTTVTFRATDDDDNFVECSFDVTITDNEAPEITCPADIEITTEDGLCGVSLANLDLGMATAADNCEGEITITNNAPTTFPLGTTEVTWTATDANGNSATCVQKVTVSDDEAPVVTQIENYTDIDTDPETCGAVINYGTIQATDNCEIESIEMTEGIASGQVFPVGITTVTYVVTDASGNQSTMTFTVTVVDNEDPMITCPGNIEVSTAEGENFAVVTFEDATATDNCEVTVTQTGGQASGSEFGPGVHTIEYTATDASGNTAVCSFTITVEDDEDPTITCPENIVQPNDPGLCGAAVEFAMPEFADNSGQVTIEQLTGPASGEFFEVGTTTVTFRATDAAGNTAECSFDVTVNDTEAPTTETMENITVNAEQEFCGAVVDFGMIGADDNCGLESVEITEGLASGEVFPVGTTTVTWTVTDIHGNTTTVSFDVTVVDNTNPIISCPGDMTVTTATGQNYAIVEFADATATDNCDVTVEQTAGPLSGSQFPIGDTTVTFTATDNSGNTAECSFTVTVEDGEDPSISCPENIVTPNDPGICGAAVEFDMPEFADNSGEVSIEQIAGPASGEVFPVGTTTVTFRATDDDDNFVECSFDVTITDNEAPEITCPADIEITTEDGLCGVSLANLDLGMATAADNCEGEITITNNAPTIFPLGTTEVTWTATDANGNSATCVQKVTVSDDEAPVVTQIENYTDIDTDPETCGAVINYGTIQATDNCEIESIEMTEGIPSGQVFPVGTTTVTYVVTDASGNQSTMTFTVTVVDNEDPMITCPGNIEVSTAEGENFAVVTFEDATATDNCEVTVTQTGGQASGSEFGPGVHTIEYTATDASGNTAVCSFTITVEDDEDPTITCPENIVQPNDPGLCGAAVEFAMPEFADNSGQVTIEQLTGPASGEFFEVGTTTVTFRATDASGNTAECSFDVTVNDTEAPTTETMENITVNAEQEFCGAVVDFGMIGADDNCGLESVEITEGLASGEVFPVGTTTVTWTVTDIHGNTTTVSFDVTVVDNTNPIISCPGDMTVTTTTGQNYAIVEFADATATDNCDVTVEQTAGPLSGSHFPIGDTTVTFTATDNSGNTAECSFTVTVEDGEDPSISCPENIVTPNDPGICGATVEFDMPEFADNSGEVSIEQIAGPASGEVFPVGTTTVTFRATDAAGNTAECSFDVTVNDDEGPSIEQLSNIEVSNDPGTCGAVVDFLIPEATDNCGIESVELTEGAAPGSEFPIGTTTITYTATDTNGNTATSTFTITVTDDEAPVIECPESINIQVEIGTSSVIVNYTMVSYTDNCEGTTVEMTEGIASGEEFPVGETTVTYTVTDAAGNTASCSFTVTVEEEPLPEPPGAPGTTVTQATCAEPTGTIVVTAVEGVTYSIDGENYQESNTFSEVAPGTYQVTVKDEFGQVSEATTVTVNEAVAAEIETTDATLCIDDSTLDLFDLFLSEYDENGTWIDNDNSGALTDSFLDPSQADLGTYTFDYVIEGNCPSVTTVTVTINDDCVPLACTVQDVRDNISKVVTPNGDGRNDYFEIGQGTECDFTYDVKIFNRWGAEIFTATSYQNNWDGFSEKSFTSSNQLPSGTYYYVIEVRNTDFEPITGYIYLGTK